MVVRQLPERPNLDQLKRQAKDLLHGARIGDPAAFTRFRLLPGFATASDASLGPKRLALHDAQSVVAREHGFPSWNDLREHVDEMTLAFDGAVDAFIEAATSGRPDRATRLLALHPGIPRASFFAAILLGDAATVQERLAAAPERATASGGARGWEPLHYLCFSALLHTSEARTAGGVAIARRLLSLGADPNLRFGWRHHGVFRPVLWAAVCEARTLPLATVLLEAGADPSDGVTLPLAAAGGNLAALDLLLAHGAAVDRPWATDGAAPLYAILHWADTTTGVQWLLEHGADPDPVFADNGETPLHVVAARWDVELAASLVTRGAMIDRRRTDGRTPYAVAAFHGNGGVAAWLLEHGASPDLADVDRLVAACSTADRAVVDAMLDAHPELHGAFAPEHYGAFFRAIEHNAIDVVARMLVAGFDPNRPDESIGKTALHVASAEGRPEAVRLLLAQGASVTARDREFHGTPLVWAAEHARHRHEGRDHAAVGQLLLEAGSPVDWEGGDEPSEAITETIAEWRGLAP